MKEFEVVIKEDRVGTITVKADSHEDARVKAEEAYENMDGSIDWADGWELTIMGVEQV